MRGLKKLVRDILVGTSVAVAIFALAEYQSRKILKDPEDYRRLAIKLYNAPHGQPMDRVLFELHPLFFWRFKPGFEMSFRQGKTQTDFPFAIDQHGHRKEGFVSHADEQANFTLAGFGDSCAAGLEVAVNYTRALADRLMAHDSKVRVKVRNAATSGYTSEQGLRQVREFVKGRVPAQLTLLHFGHNDLTPSFQDIPDKDLNLMVFYKLRLRKFLANSRLAVLLFDWLQAKYPLLRSPVMRRPRVSVADFRENMKQMIVLLNSAGSKVVLIGSVVAVPESGYTAPDTIEQIAQELERYNTVLRELSREEGVTYVDAWPSVKQQGNSYFFNEPDRDPIHPGPEGHQWLAEQIHRTLIAQSSK